MASKLALLIQGLLVMVVLVSSMGEARHLVEVATKRNNADSVKYCTKLSGKADDDASSDCFMIPGLPAWPSIPGLPTWPSIRGLPGWPGTTNQPVSPSPPKVEIATKKNDADSVKYCAKTNSVKGNGDASSDCFIPGVPGLPWWPKPPSTPNVPGGLPWWLWPFIPAPPKTPVTPSPPQSPATPGSPTSSPLL